jgi:hypothetical protein
MSVPVSKSNFQYPILYHYTPCTVTLTIPCYPIYFILFICLDRLCGLVFRVSVYRSRSPGFDSRRYQIFCEVVGLERGPLSFVSTIEEVLGINSSGSGLENREYGRGDPLRWPSDTLCPQKLILTSPTCGLRSQSLFVYCLFMETVSCSEFWYQEIG